MNVDLIQQRFDNLAKNMEFYAESNNNNKFVDENRDETTYGQTMVQIINKSGKKVLENSTILELEYIPDYLKNLFNNNGWKIIIEDRELDEVFPEEGSPDDPETHLQGLTVPNDKTIYLNPDTWSVHQACVHEFGHFVDFALGKLSFQNDFKDAAELDKSEFLENYSSYDDYQEGECFADSFASYLIYPKGFNNYCSNLYTYMKRLV